MTKAEIAAEIANKTGLPQVAIKEVLNEFMTVVKNSLIQGENVYLRDFGTFKVISRRRKFGRNIVAGERVIIPPRNIPKFMPGRDFKKSVAANVPVK